MIIQRAIAHLVGAHGRNMVGGGGHHLSQEVAREVMAFIMSGQATDAQIGAYVTALRMKGETVDEIAGSVQAMRGHALTVSVPGAVVDTCGTGGDASGTFNVSTTAAFVVAAGGMAVAKHGNRSISSQSGSADLLRALGVNIEVDPLVVARCVQEAGIGFLFAPRHHSAMRHVAGPRQELGIRTLFNVLGPLTNPANAPYQLLGVYDGALVQPLAGVLGRLGSRHAMVVHGGDGLDEITTTMPTQVTEFLSHAVGAHNAEGCQTTPLDEGVALSYTVTPEQFGLRRAMLAELRGGTAEVNAIITRRVLAGETGPQRDIVLLNAGAALSVTPVCQIRDGRENTPIARIRAGVARAADAIDSGRARRCLEQLVRLSNETK